MDIGIFMALQAFPVRRPDHQISNIHPMWRMTIRAGWNGTRLTLPQLAPDHFGMHLFNPGMTFHTGPGNICSRNRGTGAGVREHQMVAVTIIAGGRDDQSLFKKSFSMDTFGVIGQNILLRDVVYPGYRGVLAVTFTAQEWDIHLIGP